MIDRVARGTSSALIPANKFTGVATAVASADDFGPASFAASSFDQGFEGPIAAAEEAGATDVTGSGLVSAEAGVEDSATDLAELLRRVGGATAGAVESSCSGA